jgi:hypothetical protein
VKPDLTEASISNVTAGRDVRITIGGGITVGTLLIVLALLFGPFFAAVLGLLLLIVLLLLGRAPLTTRVPWLRDARIGALCAVPAAVGMAEVDHLQSLEKIEAAREPAPARSPAGGASLLPVTTSSSIPSASGVSSCAPCPECPSAPKTGSTISPPLPAWGKLACSSSNCVQFDWGIQLSIQCTVSSSASETVGGTLQVLGGNSQRIGAEARSGFEVAPKQRANVGLTSGGKLGESLMIVAAPRGTRSALQTELTIDCPAGIVPPGISESISRPQPIP